MLRKSVFPYEYRGDCEKLGETLLPKKEDFCHHLRKENVTDADYMHAKRVCKDFELKKLGEYQDLYVQGHTLLLFNLFESFLNICLEIYELGSARFLTAPGLTW